MSRVREGFLITTDIFGKEHAWAPVQAGWPEQMCRRCGEKWGGAYSPKSTTIAYRSFYGCKPSVPVKDEEDFSMSLIDERQVEVLDGFRSARDAAARHAQSKGDRATLMKI